MLFYVHHKVSLEKTCSQSSCRALVTFSHIGHVTPPIEANSNQANLLWGAFLSTFYMFLFQAVMVLEVSWVLVLARVVWKNVGRNDGGRPGGGAGSWNGRVEAPRQNLNLNYSEGLPSLTSPPSFLHGSAELEVFTKEIMWSARITTKSWFWMQTIQVLSMYLLSGHIFQMGYYVPIYALSIPTPDFAREKNVLVLLTKFSSPVLQLCMNTSLLLTVKFFSSRFRTQKSSRFEWIWLSNCFFLFVCLILVHSNTPGCTICLKVWY